MIPCDLIWYPDETYTQVLQRAVQLARKHDQVVVIHDPVSGKVVKYVTPGTGVFDRPADGR